MFFINQDRLAKYFNPDWKQRFKYKIYFYFERGKKFEEVNIEPNYYWPQIHDKYLTHRAYTNLKPRREGIQSRAQSLSNEVGEAFLFLSGESLLSQAKK
jgi:hypothetical protein